MDQISPSANIGLPEQPGNSLASKNLGKADTSPRAAHDKALLEQLDKSSIEDIVELKISRFLDQIGTFHLENMHELIMSKVEKPLLIQILRRVGGNQVQAAKILGINRNTLRKKIKLYNI